MLRICGPMKCLSGEIQSKHFGSTISKYDSRNILRPKISCESLCAITFHQSLFAHKKWIDVSCENVVRPCRDCCRPAKSYPYFCGLLGRKWRPQRWKAQMPRKKKQSVHVQNLFTIIILASFSSCLALVVENVELLPFFFARFKQIVDFIHVDFYHGNLNLEITWISHKFGSLI